MSDNTTPETATTETAPEKKESLSDIIARTKADLAAKRASGELPPKAPKPTKEDREKAKAEKKVKREAEKLVKDAERAEKRAAKAAARAEKRAAAEVAKAARAQAEQSEGVKEALDVLKDLSDEELKTAVRLAKAARRPAKAPKAEAEPAPVGLTFSFRPYIVSERKCLRAKSN